MDKRKLTTLALLAGFVLLLGGALALYRTLGRGAAPGLAVEPAPAPAATASPEQAGPEEEAAAERTAGGGKRGRCRAGFHDLHR